MYTVSELAKMFNTTKATIYSKLEDSDLSDEIIHDKRGKKLTQKGLSKLQLIMAESRVAKNTDVSINEKIDYKDEYINNLKKQIQDLQKDKEDLKNDKTKIESEKERLFNELNNKDKLINDLVEKNNNLLLVEKNPIRKEKKWWPFNK
jgi:chromosome segregation ATPase